MGASRFEQFSKELDRAGYCAEGGQIIDATMIAVPRQRKSKEENEQIKAGKTSDEWGEKKASQKDIDARWTKKNDQSYYGYKNHINNNSIGMK
jgi:transposase, IS5 family